MDLNPILKGILDHRGLSAAALDEFLHPTIDRLAKPDELPGIAKAADVILDSLIYRRKIVVFGDYDCDGICATAILSKTLKALGGDVTEFIPSRQEGYGMNDASLARMLKENPGVGLVVTVDNGINSVLQIRDLKERWMSVVVTDHHLPGNELPEATALVNPKVAAPPHLENLCGAGVAFLLANQIVSEAKRRGCYSGGSLGAPLLVLAGLATVTDIMPLLGQNRILVAEALKRFSTAAPIGLKELLLRAARNGQSEMTSRSFGFLIGPRINAAGRIASAMESLELLTTDDREIVRELARMIDGYNLERKAIEQRMVEEALSLVVPHAPAQVIDLPNGHPGVAGIVATRILESLGGTVPVCVRVGGHGSARAPAGLNIREAFVACADVLERFGGHAAAGGFFVKEGQIDEFRRKLCAYCETIQRPTQIAGVAHEPDAWVELKDLTLELADDLRLLEPFGEGNPEPIFGLRNVLFSEVRSMGADGRHLMLALQGSSLRAIQWNRGDLVEKLWAEGSEPHDLTFTLTVSDYGERHVELRVVSIS